LSREGVLFEVCRAQANWTKPSVAGLFTSLYSCQHRVVYRHDETEKSKGFRDNELIPSQLTTLAEEFRKNGYVTAAFSTNVFVDPTLGFDQGFDYFFAMHRQTGQGKGGKAKLVENQSADAVHRGLKEFLLQNRPRWWDKWLARLGVYRKPLFLYVHYMDVHNPYKPPPAYIEVFERLYSDRPDRKLSREELDKIAFQFEKGSTLNFYLSRYDAQIRFFDDRFRSFMGWLRAEGLLEPAVMLFTADHGEAFGEHGQFQHGHTLYEEELRVPLIIWGSGIAGGRRIRYPAGLIDIGPTLLDMSGFDPPRQFEGKSLAAVVRGGAESVPRVQYAENYRKDRMEVAEVVDGEKWLYDFGAHRIFGVYDLHRDRGEKNNLVEEIPEGKRREKAENLHRWRLRMLNGINFEGEVPRARITEKMRRRMKALGYAD